MNSVCLVEKIMEDYAPKRRTSFAHSVLAAGMNGMESTVHLLDSELYLASISKDSLPSVTHSLVKLLLRLFGPSPECRREHFFSFTETVSDYSIILDAKLLSVLCPPDSSVRVEVSDEKWRPLVVEVGAMGSVTGISKLAASVIAPLADRGVSVFCLSTNMDDYVMVKEVDLEKALMCLAKRFKLTCDSSKRRDIEMVKSVGQPSCCVDSPVRVAVPPHCDLTSRPLTHPYICSSSLYSICGLVPSVLPSIGTRLLEAMLYTERSKSSEPFFSLSIIEEDVSIVIDSAAIRTFPADSLYLSDITWRMIRIGEGPLGFDECGIVAQVSAPLALAEISTFYICTYFTDHTLVPATSAEHALELLNERATYSLGTTQSATLGPTQTVPTVAITQYPQSLH